jgi:glycosyltransferase involved in cell wall biosynthesis
MKSGNSSDWLISVIIPVYNGERYLAEAIESALCQSHNPLEVLIIDDGSTDSTAKIARGYAPQVVYHYQQNAGTAAARNLGMKLARGSYFAHLDADDLWSEDKLSVQMREFAADPGLDVVFGHLRQFVSPELDRNCMQHISITVEIAPGYLPGAMLVKRDAALRVGQVDTKWKIGQDMDWYMRAREAGLKMAVLPDVVLLRRIHESNKGITQRDSIHQRVHILKQALDRRRTINTPNDENTK